MESDCLVAVKALAEARDFRNATGIIIRNILAASNFFLEVQWVHSHRVANFFAHFLAKDYHSNCDMLWSDFIPVSFKNWCCNDLLV